MILMSLTLFGCATQPSGQPAPHARISQDQRLASIYGPGPATEYLAAPGAALAFDPPVLAGMPRMDLSRDDRGTSAFAGYEDTKTTYYYLRSDNRQGDFESGEGSRRHAVIETFGTSYR